MIHNDHLEKLKKVRELIFSFIISHGLQDKEEAEKLEDALYLLDKIMAYCT